MFSKVTDPNLINSLEANGSQLQKINDPAMISQLEGKEPSILQNTESSIGKYFKPSLPLGMNLISGLMSAGMKGPEANMMQQLPQVAAQGVGASDANYGLPQKIASTVGVTIPSMLVNKNIIPQTIFSGLQGAIDAPPGERMKDATINALSTLGVGKLLPHVVSSFLGESPGEIGSAIQQSHDALENKAVQGFDSVSNAVNQRGIAQVPINLNLMTKAGSYLPNTDAASNLFSKASTGDYNALRNLQTELWKRATKRAVSDLPSENDLAEEMFETRDKINEAITNHLINTGNDDLANALNESRKQYAILRDTFYNKNLPRTIPKLVDENTREISPDLFEKMQIRSKPMNKLRNYLTSGSFSPEQNATINIPQTINAMNIKKPFSSLLGKVAGTALSGAGMGYGYHFLYPDSPPPEAPP